MCDERRELKNKKHDAQGESQNREIQSQIRKAKKQAKENWIEEQCEEIYTNLTKNNTKRAYHIVKDLTTKKKKKKEEPALSKTSQGRIEKISLAGQKFTVIYAIMTHRVTVQYKLHLIPPSRMTCQY